MPMPRPREPDVTMPLPLINQVLVYLGRQPFEQVADLIIAIRQEVSPQVERFNQEAQAAQSLVPPPQGARPNGELRDAA